STGVGEEYGAERGLPWHRSHRPSWKRAQCTNEQRLAGKRRLSGHPLTPWEQPSSPHFAILPRPRQWFSWRLGHSDYSTPCYQGVKADGSHSHHWKINLSVLGLCVCEHGPHEHGPHLKGRNYSCVASPSVQLGGRRPGAGSTARDVIL